jgi:hypothetical protein
MHNLLKHLWLDPPRAYPTEQILLLSFSRPAHRLHTQAPFTQMETETLR